MSKRSFRVYKSGSPPRGWTPKSKYEPATCKAKPKPVFMGRK